MSNDDYFKLAMKKQMTANKVNRIKLEAN